MRHVRCRHVEYVAAMPNAREAHDAARPDDGNRLGDDLPRARAFHDDI